MEYNFLFSFWRRTCSEEVDITEGSGLLYQ